MPDFDIGFPLAWPTTWPRSTQRKRARFATSFARSRDGLLHELRLLGATDVRISSNIALRRDGMPYASAGEPDDPGVAVYFNLSGKGKCIPVDRWDRVKDNLRAVTLTVEALRGLERWGAKHMVDAAFEGFAALPAGNTTGAAWWDVLGVDPNATITQAREAYLRLAWVRHPDRGGNPEEWLLVQRAWDQARGESS